MTLSCIFPPNPVSAFHPSPSVTASWRLNHGSPPIFSNSVVIKLKFVSTASTLTISHRFSIDSGSSSNLPSPQVSFHFLLQNNAVIRIPNLGNPCLCESLHVAVPSHSRGSSSAVHPIVPSARLTTMGKSPICLNWLTLSDIDSSIVVQCWFLLLVFYAWYGWV